VDKPSPCCHWMQEALDSKRVARLELEGHWHWVEYTGDGPKDTIRPRQLNYCPWCGTALAWPVKR
jgi:hypothetical protein